MDNYPSTEEFIESERKRYHIGPGYCACDAIDGPCDYHACSTATAGNAEYLAKRLGSNSIYLKQGGYTLSEIIHTLLILAVLFVIIHFIIKCW